MRILSLLNPVERRRGAILLVMVILMAALEVVGIASVMPFLTVVGNPGMVEENEFLASVYAYGGFRSTDSFLMVLGLTAFLVILFTSLYRAMTVYFMNRFIEMRRHSLGQRLLETYLRQPYHFFLDRHSDDMAKSILSEVDQVVANVIRPGMELIAYGIILVALLAFIIVVNPAVAGAIIVTLGVGYVLIYLGVRGILGRYGSDRVRANKERFKAAGEALGGIKDIKLLGRERAYTEQFKGPSIRFSRSQAVNATLGQVPNFLVEALAFGGIILLTLILLGVHGGPGGDGLGGILPTLGVYAFAGLRLKPAAHKVYQGFTQLRFGQAALDSIHRDLSGSDHLEVIPSRRPSSWVPRSSLALSNVHYTYPGASAEALTDIEMDIPVGTSVGLVGTTGAGKTTLVDILLGLLRPTQGAIVVDGQAVTAESLRSYQAALGYVPQDIFLADATITENIAFGVPKGEIDPEQVERCARMAQARDFIARELSDGYDTLVGERGVRLSGGQRQRIGIARALYHEPAVLVFDEATSALDTATERAVMEAIEVLHNQKTIILIAHRLSTVRNCDQVVLLEHGRIEGRGGYEELARENTKFRALAEGNESRADPISHAVGFEK